MSGIPYPTRKGAIAALIAALVGIGVAAWLTYLHIRVHVDPTYVSVCALGSKVNCETVAASSYSVFLGLPVSIWGIVAYLVIVALSAIEIKRKDESGTIGMLALFGLAAALTSFVLAFISTFVIKAICLFCTATYLLNIFIAVVAVASAKKRGGLVECLGRELRVLKGSPWPAIYCLAVLAILFTAGPGRVLPRYWELASWRDGPSIPHGFDKDGHPWLGAVEPDLVVEEYFDYECPHCRAAHRKLRRILSKHTDRMRLVRYDYGRLKCIPNDHEQRSERCSMVRAAYCFGKKNLFWEWNDAVLAHPKSTIGRERKTYEIKMATGLGFDRAAFDKCLFDEKTIGFAQQVYEETRKNKVRDTPSYIVDGKKLNLKQLTLLIEKRL